MVVVTCYITIITCVSSVLTPCSVCWRRVERSWGRTDHKCHFLNIFRSRTPPSPQPRVSSDQWEHQFVTHHQQHRSHDGQHGNSDQHISMNQWIISCQFQRFVFVILSGSLSLVLSYSTGGYLPPVSSGHVSQGYRGHVSQVHPGHVSSLSPEYSSPPCSEYFHAQFPTCTQR